MSPHRRLFVLAHATARAGAVRAVQEAPEGYTVAIGPATRSLDQNSKFHALVSDIAKSGMPWAGKARDAAEWKTLLVSAHAVAAKEGNEIVPGIEGEFVSLRESTASMSKARGASLIEYTLAFCAMHDVKMTKAERC